MEIERKIESIERKIESIERKIESIERKIESINDSRFEFETRLESKIDMLIKIQSKSNKKIESHITFIETLYSQIKKPFHFIMSLPFEKILWNKNKLIDNNKYEENNQSSD